VVGAIGDGITSAYYARGKDNSEYGLSYATGGENPDLITLPSIQADCLLIQLRKLKLFSSIVL
jgi:hypothetical protein